MKKGICQQRQRGMTLIEVMLALAVFALAAVSMVKVASEHTRSLIILEQKTIALWVANNQLVELKLSGQFPTLGIKKGSTEMAGSTWHWTQNGIKTTDAGFRAVTLAVREKADEEYNLAELTTYVRK